MSPLSDESFDIFQQWKKGELRFTACVFPHPFPIPPSPAGLSLWSLYLPPHSACYIVTEKWASESQSEYYCSQVLGALIPGWFVPWMSDLESISRKGVD